jgi:hypothetical protein
MTLIRLGRVAGIEPFQWRFLFAFRGHFLNWKRHAGDAAVAEMGAGNLIFRRTPVLGLGRYAHAQSLRQRGRADMNFRRRAGKLVLR